MRPSHLISCGFLLLGLGGCAAAMPGHVPEKGRNAFAQAAAEARSDRTGSMAADGTYIPTQAERGYTCRRLTGVMQLKIQQVRDREKDPPEGVITTLMSKSRPRHTAGGQPSAAYSEDHARLIALNKLMAEKNCGQFDLQTALQPGNNETPEPMGGPKKPRRLKLP